MDGINAWATRHQIPDDAARISFRLAMLNRVRILQRMVNRGTR